MDGRLLKTLDAQSSVYSIAVSKDEQYLYSSHHDGSILKWDAGVG